MVWIHIRVHLMASVTASVQPLSPPPPGLILMWTDWTWLEPVASPDSPPAPGSCSQSGDKNHAVPRRKIPKGSPAAPPPRNLPSSWRT